MIVEYRSNLVCGIDFSKSELVDKIKSYFEMIIQGLIDNFSPLPNLQRCIITDNLIDDVLTLQRQLHYVYPNVTNNKFGRALGKIVTDKSNSDVYVLLDASIISFIIDDEFLNIVFKEIDNEQRNFILTNRRMAINTLYHELSHIEMSLKTTSITNTDNSVKTYITAIAIRLLEEYYACRRASEFYREDSINADSKYSEINKIEKDIIYERKQYNLRKISLDNFVAKFREFISLGLIYAISYYANFYNSEKELDTYNGLKLEKHIHNISLSLSKLFENLNAERPYNFDNLNKEILNYFEEYEIYLSDTPNGIYWSIPVNF